MWRTFGVQTLNGNAQPLFHDKLTAAMAVPPSGVDAILTVADTTKYQEGDRINLDPGQADQDTVLVTTILTPTTMQVSSQGAALHAHANNTVISLSISAAEVVVQLLDGTAGNAVLGADNTVTATPGGSAIQVLYKTTAGTPTVPFRFTNNASFDNIRTDDAWIIGTNNDTYIAAAEVI